MNRLRIYVDLAMPPEVRQLLESGTAAHDLVFPEKPITSILAKPESDPQFATVNVAFGQPYTRAIAGAAELKWIHVSTSGITRYDNPEFRAEMSRRNIAVTNSASVFQEPCAIHALSFILAQARKLPQALSCREADGTDDWNKLRQLGGTLRGETILIVGYGAIGRRLTELLQPLGMNVIACRRNPRGNEAIPVIALNQLDQALASADHIMNILPHTPGTQRFFDQKRFAAMKPGAVFYNIGRGVTVDQNALNDALRTGHLSAAWLDVTDPEPLPDNHPLRSAPNCYITPHIAGGHPNETASLVRHFLGNLDRFTRGQPLKDRVM
jgi:phosphoglycerate dehydrogenase-like enzyme